MSASTVESSWERIFATRMSQGVALLVMYCLKEKHMSELEILKMKGLHGNCIACGAENTSSLRLQFHSIDEETVEGTFVSGPHLQGYEGILHGGIVATLLDSAMAHCLFQKEIKGVTADLRVRFLHSIPCMSQLTIKAWLTCAVSTLYELKGEVILDGKVMAKAKAKFMERANVEE